MGGRNCRGQDSSVGVMGVFVSLVSLIVSWVCKCVRAHQIVQFKYVPLIVTAVTPVKLCVKKQ